MVEVDQALSSILLTGTKQVPWMLRLENHGVLCGAQGLREVIRVVLIYSLRVEYLMLLPHPQIMYHRNLA